MEVDDFVDQLFSYSLLFFSNEEFDMRVFEATDAGGIRKVVEEVFPDPAGVVTVVLKNGKDDRRCPFFRVLVDGYSARVPSNFKLETFFRSVGIKGVSSRCTRAMVMGCCAEDLDSPLCDIPQDYRVCPIMSLDVVDMPRDDTIMTRVLGEPQEEVSFTTAKPPRFRLLNPCVFCQKAKAACSRMTPCDRCVGKRPCFPSGAEAVTRIKKLYQLILQGELLHNDHAKFQLALESQVYGGRICLTRVDFADVFQRILQMPIADVPVGKPEALPECLLLHMGEAETWKIEWLLNGRYGASMSPCYADNFLSESEIIQLATQNMVPPKVVDTINLDELDGAYRMWVNSLFNPGVTTTMCCGAFWRQKGVVKWTKVRMMTVIISHEYLITATTVKEMTSIMM